MIIKGIPDKWNWGDQKRAAAGPRWTMSLIDAWQKISKAENHLILDLSNIQYIPLFEWMCAVSLIETLLNNPFLLTFNIDLLGSSENQLLSPKDYLAIKTGKKTKFELSDYLFSAKVYRLVGFLESLGTLSVLNRDDRNANVLYPRIKRSHINFQDFYGTKQDRPTVVLGLKRIQSKNDCEIFLDDHQILNWREAMGERFYNSPIFESEEIWRVLCHELSVNIWEHSGVAGFIASRIIFPFDGEGNLKWWCENTYKHIMGNLWDFMDQGFIELCVGDAGFGITNTLTSSYIRQTGSIEEPKPEDIIIFAFDELGTCKDKTNCWATERHALGRILYIVSKYGGVLVIRSGGREVSYVSRGGRFRRRVGKPGYEPTTVRELGTAFPGTQIQIILPLIPKFDSAKKLERKSVLEMNLPGSFRTQTKHVRGHLIPLLETLDQPSTCIGNEVTKFRESCEQLCKDLLNRRPRFEPLVIDFSGLNWTPPQFETLLHLLQNVLQNRPVLLVEIDHRLAQGVIRLEEQRADTLLKAKHINNISSTYTGRSYEGYSERTYLETYSRIHATVLGLDRNGKRYIFGLLNRSYEQPLLSLVETSKSIKDLCQERNWECLLKESILRTILTAVNPLFEVDQEGKWRCVWGPNELRNELSRVMSFHFNELASRTLAWRGKLGEQQASEEDGFDLDPNEDSTESEKKFKLPWQDEWREDFLEASRILSRERYADEAAQRLIYRLRKGLEIIGKYLYACCFCSV